MLVFSCNRNTGTHQVADCAPSLGVRNAVLLVHVMLLVNKVWRCGANCDTRRPAKGGRDQQAAKSFTTDVTPEPSLSA